MVGDVPPIRCIQGGGVSLSHAGDARGLIDPGALAHASGAATNQASGRASRHVAPVGAPRS
jgi:hypothetical protein